MALSVAKRISQAQADAAVDKRPIFVCLVAGERSERMTLRDLEKVWLQHCAAADGFKKRPEISWQLTKYLEKQKAAKGLLHEYVTSLRGQVRAMFQRRRTNQTGTATASSVCGQDTLYFDGLAQRLKFEVICYID